MRFMFIARFSCSGKAERMEKGSVIRVILFQGYEWKKTFYAGCVRMRERERGKEEQKERETERQRQRDEDTCKRNVELGGQVKMNFIDKVPSDSRQANGRERVKR